MAKYRKKPVEIEARQFTGFGGAETGWDLLHWIDDDGKTASGRDGMLVIETLEGEMTASRGDWIIRGVQGEFYPCKPDIFKATYELVEAS